MNLQITIIEWLVAQQGAIFVSAVFASIFAWTQIKESRRKHAKEIEESRRRADEERDENRRRDRVKATLAYLTRREWDRDFIETRSAFAELRDKPAGLEKFGKKGLGGFPEQQVIRRALNNYEMVAIGIKQGILDEEFYRLWCKSAVLTDYKASQGYINALNKAETEKLLGQQNTSANFVNLEINGPTSLTTPRPQNPLNVAAFILLTNHNALLTLNPKAFRHAPR